MSFCYHGNYCGPGYTGGKFSTKGDYSVLPVDSLDAKCREHDYGYEHGSSHQADHKLLSDTSYGLNKEGLLKLGFKAKDIFYNDLFLPYDMVRPNAKQSAFIPGPPAPKSRPKQKAMSREAFRNGVRQASTFSAGAMAPDTSLSRSFQQKAHGRLKDVIEEVEYIQDVTSTSVGFAILATLPFNPAQTATFPWAASIAKQYEKWNCDYVEFIYKPTVSQYSSLGQQGKVIMSFDYDASDSPPSTKQQAEDMQEHTDGLPYEYLRLRLKPRLLHEASGKYNRAGPLPGGSDIKTFDGGNLYLAISGLSANSGTIGELHVKYAFKLTEPILSASSLSAPVNNQVAQWVSPSAGETISSGVTTAMALSTSVTNGIGSTNAGGAGAIVLQPGNYIIMANVNVSTVSTLTVFFIEIYDESTTSVIYPSASANYAPELNLVAAAGCTEAALSQQWYLSVNNGPATYYLNVHATDTAGSSLTAWGSFLILAA